MEYAGRNDAPSHVWPGAQDMCPARGTQQHECYQKWEADRVTSEMVWPNLVWLHTLVLAYGCLSFLTHLCVDLRMPPTCQFCSSPSLENTIFMFSLC